MKKNNETIKISGLETGYISKKGNTVITRDIDASLESGELTCLLGPNGAGKSTLLKTLTAFHPPYSRGYLHRGEIPKGLFRSGIGKSDRGCTH